MHRGTEYRRAGAGEGELDSVVLLGGKVPPRVCTEEQKKREGRSALEREGQEIEAGVI